MACRPASADDEAEEEEDDDGGRLEFEDDDDDSDDDTDGNAAAAAAEDADDAKEAADAELAEGARRRWPELDAADVAPKGRFLTSPESAICWGQQRCARERPAEVRE